MSGVIDESSILIGSYLTDMSLDCLFICSPLIGEQRLFGSLGAPWEFNLRDIFRWSELLQVTAEGWRGCSERNRGSKEGTTLPGDDGGWREMEEEIAAEEKQLLSDSAHSLFFARLRTLNDRHLAHRLFATVFGWSPSPLNSPSIHFMPTPTPKPISSIRPESELDRAGIVGSMIIGSAVLPVGTRPRPLKSIEDDYARGKTDLTSTDMQRY